MEIRAISNRTMSTSADTVKPAPPRRRDPAPRAASHAISVSMKDMMTTISTFRDGFRVREKRSQTTIPRAAVMRSVFPRTARAVMLVARLL